MTDQPPVDRDDFSPTPSSQQPSTNNTSGGVDLDAQRDVMVELHGGKIWVESVEGLGSRFSFSVPSDGPKEK